MNKSELVNIISGEADISKVDASKALEAVLGSVSKALQSGESVVLVGFGTFSVKDRAPRTVRNPQSGETMDLPASRVPSFKPGKLLKEAVND